mmetsp:Transcript_16532/g.33228  ORF Transcript_16532/g.33228 Transcript_16532/m.33228 type:complete len:1196 (-) Transcript_16532:944-4531(-)
MARLDVDAQPEQLPNDSLLRQNKPSRCSRRPPVLSAEADKDTKLLPEDLHHLIAQRDEQLAFAASTKIAIRNMGRTKVQHNLNEGNCEGGDERASLREMIKHGVCEQRVTVSGMRLSMPMSKQDNLPPASSYTSRVQAVPTVDSFSKNDTARHLSRQKEYLQQLIALETATAATPSATKASFSRAVCEPALKTGITASTRRSFAEAKTFAQVTEVGQDTLYLTEEDVAAHKRQHAARGTKNSLAESLESGVAKSVARREREQALEAARAAYGVSASLRFKLERRENQNMKLEDKEARERGLTMFFRIAPRILAYNCLNLLAGVAILFDPHLESSPALPSNGTGAHNTDENVSEQLTVMEMYPVFAFYTYMCLIIGSTASIVGNSLVLIMVNYSRLTFGACCGDKRNRITSLDYVLRVPFTATCCAYLSTTLQIVVLWPHLLIVCPIANQHYGTLISTVTDISGIGTIAFGFGMLLVAYMLPVFVLLSIIETKVLLSYAYEDIFTAANSKHHSTLQNLNLGLQAFVLMAGSLVFVCLMNLNQAPNILNVPPWDPFFNLLNWEYWLVITISVMMNVNNLFQMVVQRREVAFEQDKTTLEARVNHIKEAFRMTIAKGNIARIYIHTNPKLLGLLVKINADLADCETTSDSMAIVPVTLQGTKKEVSVEEFQLAPDVDANTLAETQERSNLQVAQARRMNDRKKVAVEIAVKFAALFMQVIICISIGVLLMLVLNKAFSSQIQAVYLQANVLSLDIGGSSTILSRYTEASTVEAILEFQRRGIFPTEDYEADLGPNASSLSAVTYLGVNATESLLKAKKAIQQSLCSKWSQCLVKDSRHRASVHVCGGCTIAPEHIHNADGRYAVRRPPFLYGDGDILSLILWSASFGAVGGLLAAIFALRSLHVRGCKLITISLLGVFAAGVIGVGFSTVLYVANPQVDLWSDTTSDTMDLSTFCKLDTHINDNIFSYCMTSVAARTFKPEKEGLVGFITHGHLLNAIIIMMEMVLMKRKIVTNSQGPEAWARLMGFVFLANTFCVGLPGRLVLSYFVDTLPSVSQGGIALTLSQAFPTTIVTIGTFHDWFKAIDVATGSDLLGLTGYLDYRASWMSMYEVVKSDQWGGSNLFLLSLLWIFAVHFGCLVTLCSIHPESKRNRSTLLVLLFLGYFVPAIYMVRQIFMGFFVPSFVHNVSAILGLKLRRC